MRDSAVIMGGALDGQVVGISPTQKTMLIQGQTYYVNTMVVSGSAFNFLVTAPQVRMEILFTKLVNGYRK